MVSLKGNNLVVESNTFVTKKKWSNTFVTKKKWSNTFVTKKKWPF